MTWRSVARLEDVPLGGLLRVDVDGAPYVVVRLAVSECRALEGLCPHMRAPLERGRLVEGALVCPSHGARFNARDGRVLSGPALKGLRTLPTRVAGGRVEVNVPDPPRRT